MQCSVCTDAVFQGMDTAEAIAACASLGFHAVEFWCWWEKDMRRVCEAAQAHQMEISAFCTKFISLTDASMRGAFLEGLGESLEAARKAGTRILIAQTGADTGQPRETQRESIIRGLEAAGTLLKDTDVTLALEPLNTRYDHPGYFLAYAQEAVDILQAVDHPHIRLLYDIYHQQLTDGNILNHIKNHIGHIAHFHAAGCPGRHELSDGELRYDYLFKEIKKLEYDGFIGLEYFPALPPEEGLASVGLYL